MLNSMWGNTTKVCSSAISVCLEIILAFLLESRSFIISFIIPPEPSSPFHQLHCGRGDASLLINKCHAFSSPRQDNQTLVKINLSHGIKHSDIAKSSSFSNQIMQNQVHSNENSNKRPMGHITHMRNSSNQ